MSKFANGTYGCLGPCVFGSGDHFLLEVGVDVLRLPTGANMIADGRMAGNNWDTDYRERGVSYFNGTTVTMLGTGTKVVRVDGVSNARLTTGSHVIQFEVTGITAPQLVWHLFGSTSSNYSTELLKGVRVKYIKLTSNTKPQYNFHYDFTMDATTPVAGQYQIPNLVTTAVDQDILSVSTTGTWNNPSTGRWVKSATGSGILYFVNTSLIHAGLIRIKFNATNVGDFKFKYPNGVGQLQTRDIVEGDNEFLIHSGKANNTSCWRVEGSQNGFTIKDIECVIPRKYMLLRVANANNFVV